MTLTYEGQTLLKLSNDLLQQADSVQQIMSDLADNRKKIHLGITPLMSSILLPRLLSIFRNRYPDVDLQISEAGSYHLIEQLDSHALDMIIIPINRSIRRLPMDQILEKNYHHLSVLELEYACCVSPSHRLAQYERIGVSDVKGEPIVVFQQGYLQREYIINIFSECGETPNIVYTSSQLSTILELIAHNGMVSFMYRLVAKQRPNLRFIPLDPPNLVSVNLFWRRDSFLYSDMKKLIECVRNLNL